MWSKIPYATSVTVKNSKNAISIFVAKSKFQTSKTLNFLKFQNYNRKRKFKKSFYNTTKQRDINVLILPPPPIVFIWERWWLMRNESAKWGLQSAWIGGRVWGRIYKKWTCLGLSWLNIFNISIKVNQSCQGCLSLLSVQPCPPTGSVIPRIPGQDGGKRRDDFEAPQMRTFNVPNNFFFRKF